MVLIASSAPIFAIFEFSAASVFIILLIFFFSISDLSALHGDVGLLLVLHDVASDCGLLAILQEVGR